MTRCARVREEPPVPLESQANNAIRAWISSRRSSTSCDGIAPEWIAPSNGPDARRSRAGGGPPMRRTPLRPDPAPGQGVRTTDRLIMSESRLIEKEVFILRGLEDFRGSERRRKRTAAGLPRRRGRAARAEPGRHSEAKIATRRRPSHQGAYQEVRSGILKQRPDRSTRRPRPSMPASASASPPVQRRQEGRQEGPGRRAWQALGGSMRREGRVLRNYKETRARDQGRGDRLATLEDDRRALPSRLPTLRRPAPAADSPPA